MLPALSYVRLNTRGSWLLDSHLRHPFGFFAPKGERFLLRGSLSSLRFSKKGGKLWRVLINGNITGMLLENGGGDVLLLIVK